MREYLKYPPERTNMERNRDLRDYALVHGFPLAEDFVSYLSSELQVGDKLLDMGCGSGRAIVDLSRTLYWQGVYCDALDQQLPFLRHRFVQYHEQLFQDTGLEEGSVDRVISVCGLGMYAEDEDEFFGHLFELNRILDDDGESLLVVDPAIASDDYFELRYLQMHCPQIRVQSPTIARRYFTCNIDEMLGEAGLMIEERIMPYGSRGMMIDDEVSLRVVKI